jgi:hypothetical protein
MHYRFDSLPPDAELAGMTVSHTRMPKGFDLDSVLEGLPNGLCPCPHWGYLIEGRLIVKYGDGTQEEIQAGDVYFIPAGHTGVAEEDSVSLDFSPSGPYRQLLEHIAGKMQHA